MVDYTGRPKPKTSQHPVLRPIIEEQFILSKTGRPEDCEDSIYVDDYFVAAIDGVTSKTNRKWFEKTSGQFGATIVKQALSQLLYDTTARQAVDLMTAKVHNVYESLSVVETVKADPVQRIAISFVAVSLLSREVWLVGDCQCLLNHHRISNDKIIDRILAETRPLFLETEILRGTTIEQLLQNDVGRAYIRPLLERQSLFQNNLSTGEYWYAVIDGFPVPTDGIIVHKIPENVSTIVLATDGYPILKDSLEASEQALREILMNDPLLFRHCKSTKGMMKDYVSFDDRAYIKLRLESF